MQQDVDEVVKAFIEALSRKVRVEAVYAFGSRVKGDWIKDSDIDLVIVSEDFRDMPFTKRMDVVEEVQWRMRIRPHIEAIPLTWKEFNRKVRRSAILMDASKYWRKIL